MRPYFGGAPNAFAGGQEFGAAQHLRRQQENALAALIAEHGPTAADPVAAGQMQALQQSSQLFPHQLGAAQRSTNANEALVQQHGPVAGDPQAFGTQQSANQNLQTAGLNFARLLQAAKAKDPASLGAAFDRGLPILSAMGMPTAELAQLRQQLIDNPDFVDEFASLLSGSSSGRGLSGGQPMYDEQGKLRWVIPTETGHRVIDGFTPATAAQREISLNQGQQRIGVARQRLSLDEAKARGFDAPPGYEAWIDEGTGTISMAPVQNTGQAQEFESNLRRADQEDSTYATKAEIFNRRAATLDVSAQRALEYFGSANGGVILQNIRRGARLIPGTEAHNAWTALEEIKNNLAMDELDAMRQSSVNGSSGFGQLTERELELLKNSRGMLETTNDPAVLNATLQRIQAQVATMRRVTQADAQAAAQRRAERRAQYGNDLRAPRAPARAPRPASAQPQPAGYLDDETEELLRRYGQ